MPQSFLGDSLVFEDLRPVAFAPGALPGGIELAHLNSDNHQLLAAEASLEEARVHEALKDESPALVHELQRLEYKLNILLRLVADLSLRHNALPPARAIRLTSRGLEWRGDGPPVGASGLLSLYINPALPQPLKIPVRIVAERSADGQRIAQLEFCGLSDAVAALLDKLIFRHHRRLVAGAKLAHS